MAETFAVIGLVAAIVQFVEVGSKVLARLADFTSAVDQVPKTFRHIKTNLPLIIDSLRRIESQAENSELDIFTQDALKNIVDECQREVDALDEILQKSIPAASASSWKKNKAALISFLRDTRVKQIETVLEKYVSTLTLHQVTRNASSASSSSVPTILNVAIREREAEGRVRTFKVLPSGRNDTFVGRDAIFKQIEQRLRVVRPGSQPKAALCGLGGIG
jgi:hypothetical protein